MNKGLKYGLMGCGGCLGLFVLFIIVGAVLSSSTPSSSSTGDSSSSSSGSDQSTKQGYHLKPGETALPQFAGDTQFTMQKEHVVHSEFATYIEGVITNHADHSVSYVQITFDILNSQHEQVGTAMDNIDNLESNGKWRFKCLVTHNGDFYYKFGSLSAM